MRHSGIFASSRRRVTPSYLFFDDFIGTSGAAPDSSKWNNPNAVLYDSAGSYTKGANAFLDGNSHLVLRADRESWQGGNFAGAGIGTYLYQSGWPPTNIKASFPIPFSYETKFLMPNVQAGWLAPGWLQNVDRTTAQHIYELDCGESRTTYPTLIGMHQHDWLSGADQGSQDAEGTVSDARSNWHVVRVDATAASCIYYIDNVQVASFTGVTGTFGLQLMNIIANPGTWAAGGAQPLVGDNGPWDMLIDYVKVTAL